MEYSIIKRMIARGNYNLEEFQKKIDVLYLGGKLTAEQYEEIIIELMMKGDEK